MTEAQVEILYCAVFQPESGDNRYVGMDRESGGYPVQTTTMRTYGVLWNNLKELRDYVEKYVRKDPLRFPNIETLVYRQVALIPAKCPEREHEWGEWEFTVQSNEVRICKVCGDRQYD